MFALGNFSSSEEDSVVSLSPAESNELSSIQSYVLREASKFGRRTVIGFGIRIRILSLNVVHFDRTSVTRGRTTNPSIAGHRSSSFQCFSMMTASEQPDFRWRSGATKSVTSRGFTTGKCLGVPILAALFFIIFMLLYSPDAYKRSIAVLSVSRTDVFGVRGLKSGRNLTDVSDVNPIVLRAFPIDVVQWVRLNIETAPLLALELASVQCLNESPACLRNSRSPPPSLPIYRFAVIADGQSEPGLLLSKMVSDSQLFDWKSSGINVPPRAIVLNKGKTKVIVSVLETRPRYWYVHGTTAAADLVQEPPRAFLGLNLTEVNLDDGNRLLIPSPIDFFAWQWPRSAFKECNRTSAAYLMKKYPTNYETKSKINDSFLSVLAYTRDLMLARRITPMFSGGTGLGWYRECGIIPDTTDMDLMFPSSEWNKEFEKDLKSDKIVDLYWILGKPSDSLELSVYAQGIKIDFFALYQERNRSWVGGMIVGERQKLKWWYPKFESICAADLKGHLFYVRCDIVESLIADYGPGWYEPYHNSEFVWYESHKNIERAGKWSPTEWPSVYRKFGKY